MTVNGKEMHADTYGEVVLTSRDEIELLPFTQAAAKKEGVSDVKFSDPEIDPYEGTNKHMDPSMINYFYSKFFDPDSDPDRPSQELDQIPYNEELHAKAREFLRGTKYEGFDIIVDDEVSWEVAARLKKKHDNGVKLDQLERIINDVAVFYMGGLGPVDVSNNPDYRRAKVQLDNMIEALFAKFGYIEEENYIKFVNLILDKLIMSESKVLEFRAQLMEYAMNTFENIKTSDRYIQSLQKRGRDVINELFKFSNVWGLDDLASFLVREFGYDYLDTLRNLQQMVLSKEPISFEFLAGLFQDVVEASRFHRLTIDEDVFINAIKNYNPVFSLFLDRYNQDHYSETERLSYLLKYEKGFQEYYEWKQISYELSEGDIEKIKRLNEYSTGLGASWSSVLDLQIELLLDLWDGRDALTGELLRDENGDLLRDENGHSLVIRHHYKILYYIGRRVYYIKYDCRLSAQVPLSINSHYEMNTFATADDNAKNFERVMKKLMRGEWAVPTWWENPRAISSFEQNLIRLGYIRPNILGP